MLSTLRNGPKILLIGTPEPEILGRYFTKMGPGLHGSFLEIFDATQEEHSIVILTQGNLNQAIPLSAIQDSYSLPVEMEAILCRLLLDGMNVHVRQIRMAPRLILLRGMGDMDASIEAVQQDHPGDTGKFLDLMNRYHTGTVVAITEKPLHRVCGVEDIYPTALHIDMAHGTLYKALRPNALKYLNAGIGNKDWTELEIRIYDRISAYSHHYKRLLQMIEALELGLILGESWGKDNPRFMMTVDVYRVRLMTFMDPAEIKRCLVGLEYLEDGMRIADHDVYLNRRKIGWNQVAKGYADSREALGRLYRSRIIEKLTPEENAAFIALETEIRDLQKE